VRRDRSLHRACGARSGRTDARHPLCSLDRCRRLRAASGTGLARQCAGHAAHRGCLRGRRGSAGRAFHQLCLRWRAGRAVSRVRATASVERVRGKQAGSRGGRPRTLPTPLHRADGHALRRARAQLRHDRSATRAGATTLADGRRSIREPHLRGRSGESDLATGRSTGLRDVPSRQRWQGFLVRVGGRGAGDARTRRASRADSGEPVPAGGSPTAQRSLDQPGSAGAGYRPPRLARRAHALLGPAPLCLSDGAVSDATMR